MEKQRRVWVYLSLMFFIGAVVGKLGLAPHQGQTPSHWERILQRYQRTLDAARVRVILEPTWENYLELAQHLCLVREAETTQEARQGSRTLDEQQLAPSREQLAVLQRLEHEASTPEQDRQCARLRYRMNRIAEVYGPLQGRRRTESLADLALFDPAEASSSNR